MSDIDLEMKNFSVSDVISFLKSSFRVADFDKVEQRLRQREAQFRVEKEVMKVKLQRNSEELAKEMEKRDLEFETKRKSLENELEVSRKRCVELEERNKKAQMDSRVLWEKKGREAREAREDYVEVEKKLNELGVEKVAVEEELSKYKRKCEQLEEKVENLMEKSRKKEEEEKEQHLRLKRENEELERRVKIDNSKNRNLGSENLNRRSQNKVNCVRRNEKPTTVKEEEIDEVAEEDYGDGSRIRSQIEVEGRSKRKASSSSIIEILDSDEEMGPRKGSKWIPFHFSTFDF